MSSDPTAEEIAEAAPEALTEKAEQPWPRSLALAVAAGVLIGFGGIAFLVVQAGSAPSGSVQLLSGLAFSAGLVMVVVTGAELFTGNTMLALPAATGRTGLGRVATAWTIVWAGNLMGSLFCALLFWLAGGLAALDGAVGEAAVKVADTKLAKGTVTTLASGVLANMLVCVAVWMAMGARTLPAKAVALVIPVTVFVAAGFEHSVANMSLIPMGFLAGSDGTLASVAHNLAVSTAGNIAGGIAVALGFGLSFEHRDEA